jgi:hypothetical protein
MVAEATLPLFILGIVMLIFAIGCELIELQVSNQTLEAELADGNS